MKTIFTFLFLLFVITNSNAQWTQINTGSTDDYIHVSFVNDSIGILSSNQVLMLTKDYSNSWDTIYYNSDDLIGDAQFLNDSTIFFVGYSPTSGSSFLKKTFNLGNSWTTINSGGNGQMFFTSLDTGHIFGDEGTIRTINGGVDWLPTTRNPDSWNFIAGNIYFTISSTGYYVGCYNPVIYKTIDYGENWNLLSTPFGCWQDIHFPSINIGYVCGYGGAIAKTNNAGENWDETLPEFSVTSYNLYSIYCPTENSCYSVGENGVILKTTDGGTTWQQDSSGTSEDLRSVYCTSQYCYVVGINGTILRTVNTLNSINENKKKENEIKIYPNPVAHEITIETAPDVKIQQIKLYDITGKHIKTFPPKSTLLNIATIPQGHYLLTITTNKGTFTEKIIKK